MRRPTTAGSSRRSALHGAPAGPTLVCLAVVSALAGCTSSPAAPAETQTPGSGEAPVAGPGVSAPVTRVSGHLPDRDRLALRRQVEELVSGWVAAAFLDPTTSPEQRFPGFTEGAARLARTKGAVLSRSDLELGAGTVSVEVVRAEAPVAVLAPRGRPAGATARLDLRLRVTPSEDAAASVSSSATAAAPGATASERVRLQGRLLLTPVGQGWQVFGFDVRSTGR